MQGGKSGPLKGGSPQACKRAGIEDYTFHDLRHTVINNWLLQGHDYFRIMAAIGHKTMIVFKRYNNRKQGRIESPGGGENLTQ
jgi:integrase